MNKKVMKILNIIKKQIYSLDFLKLSRFSTKDFIRKRKMPFPEMILFMINTIKQTMQKELTNFVELFLTKTKNITKSALSQSRMKLKPEAFTILNDSLVKEFYTDNYKYEWKKFRLLATDGSQIQLPPSDDIKKEFGCKKNQYGEGMPMAQISTCYDVLNNITIDTQISECNTDEYNLALKHFNKTKDKDLLIYDRGYTATWFMYKHLVDKRDFVIRMQRNSINEVRDFFNSNEKDKIIEIKELTYNSKQRFRDRGIKFKPFKIRLVKVILDTGETEVLATSLLNKDQYPLSDFKELYWKRWGVEVSYDNLKNNLQVEDFTGLSSVSIKQDFFASVFILNIQAIIIREANDELKEEGKHKKYEYKINRRLSLGFMKDRVIKIIMHDCVEDYNKLKELFKMELVPIRPNRKNERINRCDRKKFFMNKKRAV